MTDNISLYPQYVLIQNTTEVQLLLDDQPWSGQKVTLWSNGKQKYTLTEKTTGSGIYQNAKVTVGDYDVYVNGRKADKSRKLYNGMIKCRFYMYFK